MLIPIAVFAANMLVLGAAFRLHVVLGSVLLGSELIVLGSGGALWSAPVILAWLLASAAVSCLVVLDSRQPGG